MLRIIGLPFKMSLEMFMLSTRLYFIPADIKKSGRLNKKIVLKILDIIIRFAKVDILRFSVYRDELNHSVII